MPKRLTDTDKWKKPFIRGLDGAYKLLWMYMLDDCDHAGVWQVDFEVARIRTGEPDLNYEKAKSIFGDRVTAIDKFKWFIPDFISFQYGELKESNRMHLSVIALLKKHGVYEIKGHQSLLEGANNKDKDKVKDKDKDKGDFQSKWNSAFDEQTIEGYKMNYKFLDINQELSHFRLKCDSDPNDYHNREHGGLRLGFLKQLKGTPKPKEKPNAYQTGKFVQ